MAKPLETIYKLLTAFWLKPAALSLIFSDNLDNSRSYAIEKKISTEIISQWIFLNHLGKSHIRRYNKLPKKVKILFCLGCYEILYSHHLSTPEIISTILNISDQQKVIKPLKSLLNGSLRNISNNKESILKKKYPLEIKHSIPDNIASIYRKRCKKSYQEVIKAIDQEQTETGFRFHPIKTTSEEITRYFSDKNIDIRPSKYAENFLFAKGPVREIIQSPFYQSGEIYIQDEVMACICQTLREHIKEGIVLDYCAAPGGKTLGLFERSDCSDLLVFAYDKSGHRMKKMKENVRRLGITQIVLLTDEQEHSDCTLNSKDLTAILEVKDVPEKYQGKLCYCSNFEDELKGKIDHVIMDVPCSGLGTLYKNPEIKYLYQGSEGFVAQQMALLEKARYFAKIHRSIYYITCTLSPEENEHVIAAFLEKRLDCIKESLTGSLINQKGELQLWHSKDLYGGGYCTLLKKQE